MLQPLRCRLLFRLILASAAALCPAAVATSVDMNGVPGSDLPEAAKQAPERAAAAGKEGQQAEAIKLLTEARKTAPYAPQVLYGLGRANDDFGGREVAAIAWLHAYLAVAPHAENAAQVRQRIAELDAAAEGHVLEYVRIAREALGTLSKQEQAIELSKHKADLIAATGLMGRLPEAIEWGRQAEEDEDAVITLVAYAQAEAGAAGEALKAAHSLVKNPAMKGWIAKAVVFSRVKAGDASTALAAAELLADDKDRDEALAAIAPLQAKYGDTAGAAATLARIKDGDQAAKACEGIVAAKIWNGDIDRIFDFLPRVKGSKDACYSKIVGLQIERGDLSAAEQTAQLISDASPAEKMEACFSLAAGYRAAGDLKRSHDLLKAGIDVLAKVPGLDSARFRMGGPWFFLAHAAADGVPEALDLVPRCLDTYHQCLVYCQVAQSHIQDRGDTKAARETLAKALPLLAGAKNERNTQDMCFRIALIQARLGDLTGARQTSTKFIANPSATGLLQPEIAAAQVLAGDVPGAIQTADAISDPKDKATAYARIAAAQAQAGDLPGALRTADAIPDPKEKGAAYAGIAGVQAKAGDVEGAFRTATAAADPGGQALACRNIATERLNTGDQAAARQALIQASAALQRDSEATSDAWVSLAQVQMKVQDIEGARRSMKQAVPLLLKERPPRPNEHGFYRNMCRRLAEVGDFEAALTLTGSILNREERVAAFQIIAGKQRQSGDPEGAARTLAMVHAKVEAHAPMEEAAAWISRVESITAPAKVKPGWNEAPLANLNASMEYIRAAHILDQFRYGAAAANLLARRLYELRAMEARWSALRADPDASPAAPTR